MICRKLASLRSSFERMLRGRRDLGGGPLRMHVAFQLRGYPIAGLEIKLV